MAESTFRPTAQCLSADFFTYNELKLGPVLGRGMTGEVVLATRLNPDRPPVQLACKKFSLLTPDGGVKNRALFGRETTILRRLNHPHIIRLVLSALCPDYLVLCTEFCPKSTLSSNLLRITPRQCGLYFVQVACAVRYLNHKVKIVHCDIKPRNIFIDFKDDAVLGDFGMAISVSHQKRIYRSAVGGTHGYMAPELSKNQEIDPLKLDVYSLGVVLWCMGFMTETTPDNCHTYLQKLKSVSGIPEPFRWCMETMLEPDPAVRPDISTVLEELRGKNFFKSLIDTDRLYTERKRKA